MSPDVASVKAKRPRSKTAVHFFLEGGFLVRGTLNPHAALQLAIDEGDPYQLGHAFEMGIRPEGETDDRPTVEEVGELADLLHGYLSNAKPGLYRIVPAGPTDDEYGWFMRHAEERGRGVFEGVVLW